MLFELHYRGFDDARGDPEWRHDLIAIRGKLEARMEAELRSAASSIVSSAPSTGDLATDLFDLIEAFDGPSMASFLQRHASREQALDFLVQRSIYALKESDAHSFVLPRLSGTAKTALVEIQYDEYGSGRPERLHSTLFAEALDACGLNSDYGAYIDAAHVETLAANNVHSLFGLHRRLRAAAAGLLATFEATGSLPSRRIVAGLQRLRLPAAAAEYYLEHIEADAVHEQIAVRDICAVLVDDDPDLRADVIFGAAACLQLDAVVGHRALQRWNSPASEESGSKAS